MIGIVDHVVALDFDIAALYALLKNEEKHMPKGDGKESPRRPQARCDHGNFKTLPSGELECGKCGERGN